jgi:hypothetical protein
MDHAMLELRPNCENCGSALPPSSIDALICSFECTFCAKCVTGILRNVCPNCGGGFERRPIRPAKNWKRGNSLDGYPASVHVKHRPVDAAAHAEFSEPIQAVPPEQR